MPDDHLVGDAQDFVAVADFTQPGEVVVGRRVDTTGALDRLGDHSRDCVEAFLLDRGDNVVDHQVAALDPGAAGRGDVGCRRVDDVGGPVA